jgi:NAD(P)-dependent dehydrogenase (short-subunit alcohol dehydrogenase family)
METLSIRQGTLNGRLKDEIAIVTGAGQGIGKVVAERLTAEGAAVAVLDNNEQTGEAAEAELSQRGGQAMFARCDVADRVSVRRAVREVVKAYGRVSVLVNNAGIGLKAPFLELSDEAWRKVIDTNLTGTFMVSQEVCREMVRLGRGSVVNVGSIAGRMAHSDQVAYAVSKSGIEGLTRMMAFELAPLGIRVNAVAPGTIATEFLAGMLTEEARHERERRIPMGRLGTPEEVAGVIAFLVSEEARYMTGSIVSIDGGLLFAGVRT